jgi:hypothetical protein
MSEALKSCTIEGGFVSWGGGGGGTVEVGGTLTVPTIGVLINIVGAADCFVMVTFAIPTIGVSVVVTC